MTERDFIRQSGNFGVGVNKGLMLNSKFEFTDYNQQGLTQEVQDIIDRLYQEYPDADESGKQAVLRMELQKKVKQDPTFRERFISAMKAGGFELTKLFTSNTFVSVPIEMVRGWIEV